MGTEVKKAGKKDVKRKSLHRIVEVLRDKDKSAYWLAQETEISYTSIHSYISNKVVPGLPQLFKIAEALKVNPKDLINS
jgi:putative transcriptional regulator